MNNFSGSQSHSFGALHETRSCERQGDEEVNGYAVRQKRAKLRFGTWIVLFIFLIFCVCTLVVEKVAQQFLDFFCMEWKFHNSILWA